MDPISNVGARGAGHAPNSNCPKTAREKFEVTPSMLPLEYVDNERPQPDRLEVKARNAVLRAFRRRGIS
jgi:hypothetical protein